jgi:serine O-acetyltransferase
MQLNGWMNDSIPAIADKMERSINADYHVQTDDGLGMAGRLEIFEILDKILAVLFPGCYCKDPMYKEDLNFFLNTLLREIAYDLNRHLTDAFMQRCDREQCEHKTCQARAKAVTTKLILELPEIRDMLLQDIKTAFEGDPAAGSIDEIVLAYPCVDAVSTYRIAHLLYTEHVPIIPRIMSERAHSRTGIDIHPGALIAPGFFIDHGTGVVIGETCTIGRNVKLYQGVTLGALSPFDKDGRPRKGEKRHPDIEDDVIIYANATILGGKTVIGKGAIIGGNTWITKSVPPGTVVYRDS